MKNGHIKTELRSYYIVGAIDSNEDYFFREIHGRQLLNPIEGITINLVDESLIVGLVATKLEEYDSHYWGTISQYMAIEIIYESEDKALSVDKEKELINSYIFEVADSTGIALCFNEIRIQHYLDDLREKAEENPQVLRDLEPYNEGMRLFVSAVQIQDQELKFLCF